MKRLLIILLAMLPLMGMAKKKMTKPDVSVSWLRVENLEKPLGIDTDKPRLKPLYQEALCIWLAGTNAPLEEWEKYIRRGDVFERFQQYNAQRGNPAFKGTYWYYFDKTKAPEV